MTHMSQSDAVTREDLTPLLQRTVTIRFKYGSMVGTLSEFRGVFGFRYANPTNNKVQVAPDVNPGETFADITFLAGDVLHVIKRHPSNRSTIILKD